MTTNTDPSALVSQYFAANPTATPDQVAAAVQSYQGGMTPAVASALAAHYGTDASTITNDFTNWQATNAPASTASTASTGALPSSTTPAVTASAPSITDLLGQYNSQTQQGIKNAGLDTVMQQVNSGVNANALLSQGLTPQAVGSYKDASGNQVTAPPNTYVVSNPDGSGGSLNYFFQIDPKTGATIPISNAGQNLTYTPGSGGGFIKNTLQSLGPIPEIATAIIDPALLPLVTGGTTAIETGNLGKGLTTAALTYGAQNLAPLAGNAVSSATSDTLGSAASKIAGGAASALTGAEISSQGKADPLTALESGGISSAVPLVGSQIPGYSSLSAAQQAAVNKVIGGALTGQSANQTAINAAIAAGAQEVKNQTGGSPTTSTGTSGVASVNAGNTPAGTEVIDPNSVTNAATVASSANAGANSEQLGQYTSSTDTGLGKSMFDMPVNQIDASKLSADNPMVSTDPNTGIKQTLSLDDQGNVVKSVIDPVLKTNETTTVNSDGSYEVVNYDKLTGLQTTDNYDENGNLISSNSEEFGSSSDLNPVTVTGSSGTYSGDLSTLPSVTLPDSTVAHVDLTNSAQTGSGGTGSGSSGSSGGSGGGGGGGGGGSGGGGGGGGGSSTTTTNNTNVIPASSIAGNISGAGPNPITESLLKSMMENPAKYQNVLQQVEDLSKQQNASMIDPKLAQLLQAMQNPTAKSGLQNDWFTYGQAPTSVDQILGLKNLESEEVQPYKTGGHVEPLAYKKGGLSVVDGRHDFRDGAHVAGDGDGTSDDIPAMLADGEFVFPADVVAALGNGSTKAGTDKLYEMMHGIRARARSAKPGDLPPDALKSPLDYLKGKK